MATAFGYKCNWYVVRSTDTAGVASMIGLQDGSPASWRDGVDEAYGGRVFVTPPVGEWTTLISAAFREYGSLEVESALKKLSEGFGTAMLFGTYRVVDFHQWVKAEAGQITRAYCYMEGDVLEEGDATPDELELGYGEIDESLFDEDDDEEPFWMPDEEFVMKLAGKWCFNPQDLEKHPEMTTETPGLLGRSADLLP